MDFRCIYTSGFLLLHLLLAACDGQPQPTALPPTATLRGAMVPTRVTLTSTVTSTPSATATSSPTASTTPTATIDQQATQDAQATLAQQAVIDAQATVQAQAATFEAFNAQSTETAAIQNAQSTQHAQATNDAIATQDTRATLDVFATETQNAIATNAQMTLTSATKTVAEDIVLAYGDVVLGTISEDTFLVEYTFEARAGDVVTIGLTAISGDLDTLLTLYDSNGNELTSNDDVEMGNTNSRIEAYEFVDGGTYTIQATRLSERFGNTTGDFNLSLEQVRGVETLTDPVAISYGETVQGRIEGDVYVLEYTFEGQVDDVIGVRMNVISGDLDPLLYLRDSGGNILTENNDDPDGGETLDSYIGNFALPANGTYTLVATRFQEDLGLSSGDFEIILEMGNSSAIINERALLTTFSGRLGDREHFQTFTFPGEAGQVVTIQMDGLTDDLDPFLILLDPSGRQIARNDDRDSNRLDSTLDHIVLPDAGEYQIVATRFQNRFGSSEGRYTIEVYETVGENSVAGLTQPIEIGTVIKGAITDQVDTQYYTFQAQAGDILDVSMTADNNVIDPFLILEDGFGNELVRQDDNLYDDYQSNAVLNNVLIPADGFYTISASVYVDTEGNYDTGTYELLVKQAGNIAGEGNLPLRGVLYDSYSNGYRADDLTLPYFAAGDWLDNADNDSQIYALLTYDLPDLDNQEVDTATLDLSKCFIVGDDPFGQFGTLTLYGNAVFRTNTKMTDEIQGNRRKLVQMDECQSVDLTNVITEAYNNDAKLVQFQIVFEERTTLENTQTDSVIFTNPILEIVPR